MINVILFNKKEKPLGFEITNHGKDIVCSAVSALSLNTVNSIKTFTNAKFTLDFNKNGGFLKFIMLEYCENATLLLNSLILGLEGIKLEYYNQIDIKYKEV